MGVARCLGWLNHLLNIFFTANIESEFGSGENPIFKFYHSKLVPKTGNSFMHRKCISRILDELCRKRNKPRGIQGNRSILLAPE